MSESVPLYHYRGVDLPPGYVIQEGSIFHRDEETGLTRIAGAPASVPTLSRTLESEEWFATVAFVDQDGREHDLRVKSADLCLTPTGVVRKMLDGGFPSHSLHVKSLCRYLQEFRPTVRQWRVSRGGWIETDSLLVFVFPGGHVVGDTHGQEVVYDGHR